MDPYFGLCVDRVKGADQLSRNSLIIEGFLDGGMFNGVKYFLQIDEGEEQAAYILSIAVSLRSG